MPQYLTPSRYRTMGTGVTLPTDAVLASHIGMASALVNAYCCVPAGYDFRGGSITGEQHDWDMGNKYRAPSNRVWPFCRPIKSVTSLEIDVTNNQRVSFLDASSLYVNTVEGWVEPVDLALTTFGVFGYGILPNIGLHQPVARLSYTYGYDFEATEEVVAASGGALMMANQFLTDDEVALLHDGNPVTDPFTVDRTEGTIDYPLATVGDTYTLSYHYRMPSAISYATSLLVTDMVGASQIAAAQLTGLSSIKVEEVELRQGKSNFLSGGVVGAAAAVLAPYVVRSMA